MKKSIIPAGLAIGCMMILLGGCYEPLPITDREMDIVAEYAAGVLVKYGTDSKEILLNKREQEREALLTITPTVKPTATSKPDFSLPTPTPDASDKNVTPAPTKAPDKENTPTATPVPDNTEATMQDLTNLLAKEDFKFKYNGYTVTTIYQGAGEMFAAAGEGKKLIVLEFSITNTAGSSKTLSMNKGATKDCIFTLRAGSQSIKPTLTLLKEDFYTSYEVAYKGGETKKGVLVFECPEKTETGTMNLTVFKENAGKEDSVIVKIN